MKQPAIPSLPKQISTPVIETDRLLIKEVTLDTLNELYATCTDEYIMSFLGLHGEAEFNTEKNKWQGGFTTYRTSVRIFLLTDKQNGKVIGRASFHNWYPLHRRAELGYLMTDEAMKNRGYMKEAVKAIIAYGFEQLDLNRIEAFVGKENPPSLKIMKNFGFTQEGILREHFNKNGIIEDSVCFALLKKEWEAMNK